MIRASFYLAAEQLFASGTKIGAGGEGEVRRVEWNGAAYAIKRSQRIGLDYQSELGSTAWVQVPLTRHLTYGDECGAGDNAYDLLLLASGDLWHAGTGRQAALAACSSQNELDTRRGVAQQPEVLPPLWSRAEFAAIAAETLVAVDHMHTAGLRHADIKPQTFLVTGDNHLCLADLGCADYQCMHATGMGTEVFFAPEQQCKSEARRLWCDDLQELGQALGWRFNHRPVDVWQLAVTWLFLLCPVGQGTALVEFIQKLSRPRLLPRRRLPKATPAWLKTGTTPSGGGACTRSCRSTLSLLGLTGMRCGSSVCRCLLIWLDRQHRAASGSSSGRRERRSCKRRMLEGEHANPNALLSSVLVSVVSVHKFFLDCCV